MRISSREGAVLASTSMYCSGRAAVEATATRVEGEGV